MRRTKRALAVHLVLQCLLAAVFSDASPQDAAGEYCWRPLSVQAIPHVAIIGTAKAGTTDLHMLLTKTSGNPFTKRKIMVWACFQALPFSECNPRVV